jgi:hypothetical protein
MRYKPAPEPKVKLHPLQFDLSDLQFLLDEFPGAELHVETKTQIFDSVADIEKYAHEPLTVTRMNLLLHDDPSSPIQTLWPHRRREIQIIPRFAIDYPYDGHAADLKRAEVALTNFRRTTWWRWFLFLGAAVAVGQMVWVALKLMGLGTRTSGTTSPSVRC